MDAIYFVLVRGEVLQGTYESDRNASSGNEIDEECHTEVGR